VSRRDAAPDCRVLRKSSNGMTVVFIHGVISNESAWQHPDGTFWPYLVQEEGDLQEYGLYLFNYRTDFFSGSHSLDDVTAKLKHQIEQDLPNERGFVFVGHSMGGIVARNYIVQQQLELHKRGTTIGVVLIASPSAGSSYANLVARISPLYHSQLYSLRSGQTNDWLNALDRQFINIKERRYIDISGKEMIEDNALGVLRFFLQRAQIVPPASAAKYFADYVRIEYSDHISISKPKDRDAQQHRVLCQWLRGFARGGGRKPNPPRSNRIAAGESPTGNHRDAVMAVAAPPDDPPDKARSAGPLSKRTVNRSSPSVSGGLHLWRWGVAALALVASSNVIKETPLAGKLSSNDVPVAGPAAPAPDTEVRSCDCISNPGARWRCRISMSRPPVCPAPVLTKTP
jgi:pimeloyl-ACP methyl ester carboxylesterase